jgi:N-acyl amino acid synthase of PEP-CTERM/exosortase system
MPKPSPVGLLPSALAHDAQLLACFDAYFRTQEAISPELINCALALRYQVYCLEREFEDAAHFSNQLETDALDPRSLHGLVFHRMRGEAIGTVRLILPEFGDTPLPVQQLLKMLDIDTAAYLPFEQTAEVSRFAISRELRQRRSDDSLGVEDARPDPGVEYRSNLPCLGLVQILVRMSLARGISYWTALMEPKLLRMLATMGICFRPVGPLVSHHGIRQPSFCHVPTMLEVLRSKKPDYWEIVTDGGTLSYATVSTDFRNGSLEPERAAGRFANRLVSNE